MKNFALLAFIPFAATAQNPVVPVLNQLVGDQVVGTSGGSTTIALDRFFGTEEILDNAVRLTAEWLAVDGTPGSAEIDFLLFRDRTPITTENFLGYVNREDYTNMIVHRVVQNFVVQGGGFSANGGIDDLAVDNVPVLAPIQNEFGVSNTLGTISMAKLGGNPDSATSQWFISTGANSTNLDFQNGGFTVFGRVSQGSFSVAQELNDLGEFNLFNLGGALTATPLVAGTVNDNFTAESFYRFSSVAEVPLPAGQAGTAVDLTYSVVSAGGGLMASISDQFLTLNSVVGAIGTRETVVVQAEDSVGNQVVDTFEVLVTADYESWRRASFTPAEVADDAISGPEADPNNDGVTNLVVFAQGLPTDADVSSLLATPRLSLGLNSRVIEIETPLISGVGFEVEASVDLDDWTPVSSTEESMVGANTITVQLTTGRDFTASSQVFLRVRYSLR